MVFKECRKHRFVLELCLTNMYILYHHINAVNASFIYLFSESVLAESEVSTQVTTFGQLVPSEADPSTSTTRTETETSVTTFGLDDTGVLEGWQKSWEESEYKGINTTNIRWLRDNEQYGLFESAKPFKNTKGEVIQRRMMKSKMEFTPPPIPVTVRGQCRICCLSSPLQFFSGGQLG